MSNRNLFLYWVGKEYKLITILKELIYLHSKNGKGYNVIFINDKNINEYIKNIPDYFYRLAPAHQSDFVRVNVVCDYGGIWLDSDTLVIEGLDSLFDLIENRNGFFIRENNSILWNGVFGSIKETPLMIEWKRKMNEILEIKKEKIEWAEIGCFMLRDMRDIRYPIKNLYDGYAIMNGLDNLYPITAGKCETEYLDKPYNNYKHIIRNYQPLIVLVNSVYLKLENISVTDILNKNTPLNYFIDKSLKKLGINRNEFIKVFDCQSEVLCINKEKIVNKYIIVANWIKTYLTLEPYTFAKKLELLGWKIIDLSNLDIENIKKEKCIVLCITYDEFDISQLKCDNVFLIYKIDDLYPFKKIRKECINCSDMIVGPYQYLFYEKQVIKMYPKINTTISFHIPYSAVNEFYLNIEFNETPIEKIFVSGSISDYYPLRSFVKMDNRFKQYIEVLDHPSNNSSSHNIINEEYYKKLNKYLCCFTDALSLRYVLLKVFEICSVGSLLLVQDSISEELNKLGLYDNLQCIMCNKSNVEEKIKWILDIQNREKINNIRKSGMDLVRTLHNTQQRAIQFNKIVKNLFD